MRQSPFLQSVHQEMLRRRYAKRTIETYLHWISVLASFRWYLRLTKSPVSSLH
ncbi:phage integrase N-terminal SAM-like domain-containing protein [Nitrincola lacisaponensis]|uniref:phage integrase N-terminal SAM-like domain-containing protein n=1 Tax=Nitrincola lacisaponensis TaxID=267850 RepID=UPI003B845D59